MDSSRLAVLILGYYCFGLPAIAKAYYLPGRSWNCPAQRNCQLPCRTERDFRGCDICLCSANSGGPCSFTNCGAGWTCVEEKTICPAPNCDLPQARCVQSNSASLPSMAAPLLPVAQNLPMRECLLSADSGPCEAAITRWFFNARTRKCEMFFYGGCQGNANNFMSLTECQRRCPEVEPVPGPPDPNPDTEAPCPAVLCAAPEVPCKSGLARNERGCEICECATGPDPDIFACPAIACLTEEPCEFGPALDSRGCPSCSCVPNPCINTECASGQICQIQVVQCVRAPCPPVAACVSRDVNPECLNEVCDPVRVPQVCGIINYLNQEGCNRCARSCDRPFFLPCPSVLCAQNCTNGFGRDERGCQTCECQPGPSGGNELGFCPVGAIPECKYVSIRCTSDKQCKDGDKCCQIGCERRCAGSVPIPPPRPPPVEPNPGPCATVRCGSGTVCVEQEVQCITMPCNPVAACVSADMPPPELRPFPAQPSSCAVVNCIAGTVCRERVSLCGSPVCPTVAACESLDGKPGECPPMPSGTAGICIQACSGDSECPGDNKCCSNGCGNVCLAPAEDTVVAPSEPLPQLPVSPPSTCAVVLCIVGTICRERGSPCRSPPCPVVAMCEPTDDKPGDCPSVPSGTAGICIQACDGDSECPADNKCCSNGCGNVCLTPVRQTEVKPGFCPTVSSDTVGICIQACDGDSACPDTQKCCSNGCGSVCTAPVQPDAPAEQMLDEIGSNEAPTSHTSSVTNQFSDNSSNTGPRHNLISSQRKCFGPWCLSVRIHRGKSSRQSGSQRIRKVILHQGKKITVSY